MLKVGPRTCRWRTVHTTVHNQQALIETANIVVIGTNTTITTSRVSNRNNLPTLTTRWATSMEGYPRTLFVTAPFSLTDARSESYDSRMG